MFDEQIFLLQRYGGISRYFTELIKAFELNPDLGITPVLSSRYVINEYLLEETTSLSPRRLVDPKWATFHLLFQLVLNRKPQQSVDLVHHTFYLPGFFQRFRRYPKVVTLFDMIPEKINKNLGFWNDHYSKSSILPLADLVLSISESSTKDMLMEYGIEREVPTTYLGVGPEFQAGLPRKVWLPEKYFLFVGNRGGYKNCELALRSFSKIAKKHPETVFLLIGGGPLHAGEIELASTLEISGRIIQREVPSEELPSVYSGALGLIYPSLYEGFGLPLVEAMACGIPVIASDIPINHEIAKESAMYFSAGDEEKLAELMADLVSNPGLFRDKIAVGQKRSQDFTWYKCAERTAEEYHKLLEKVKESRA
jgi:glycosyltransferase involved in cell wall biosynthesis